MSAFFSLCNGYFSQTQSLSKLNTLDLNLFCFNELHVTYIWYKTLENVLCMLHPHHNTTLTLVLFSSIYLKYYVNLDYD